MSFPHSVFNTIQNPIAVITGEGVIVHLNEAWKEYGEKRGGDYNRCIENNYFEACRETESGRNVLSKIEELKTHEIDSFSLEYPCHGPIEKDWYRVHGSRYEQGEDTYIVLEHININKQKILKQENDALESFISSHMAYLRHEIKNKTTIILGHTQLVEKQIAQMFPKLIDEHLTPVIQAGDKITSILDSTELDSPLFAEVNLRELSMQEEVWNVWSNIPTEEATLTVTTDIEILADTVQLEHLLENIFLNAIEHSNVEHLDITIGNLQNQNGIYIQDNGEGFEDLNIFEADSDRFRSTTGIGLNLIKRIVENHNWEITLTNTDRGGRIEISNMETIEEHQKD